MAIPLRMSATSIRVFGLPEWVYIVFDFKLQRYDIICKFRVWGIIPEIVVNLLHIDHTNL